jgi:hypothetical protein
VKGGAALLFDANEGVRRRQERPQCLLCNREPLYGRTAWCFDQPVPWSGAQACQSGSEKCARQNHCPHCEQRRCPGSSQVTSRGETPLQSFFGSFFGFFMALASLTMSFYGCRSTTATLFTPLHARYRRPSEVAAILRTVPPPEGIVVRAN